MRNEWLCKSDAGESEREGETGTECVRHNPKVILLMNFWYFFSISIWPYVRTHTRAANPIPLGALQLWIRSIYIPDSISHFFLSLPPSSSSSRCTLFVCVCAPEYFRNLNPDKSAKEQMNLTIYFVILLVRCALRILLSFIICSGVSLLCECHAVRHTAHHTHHTHTHTISHRSLQSLVRLNLRFGNKYTKMPRNQNSTPTAHHSHSGCSIEQNAVECYRVANVERMDGRSTGRKGLRISI